MQEVYVVVQTLADPPRDFIVAVCATKQRAERYVDNEHCDDYDLFVRVEPVLN
jgi:hypothetical protein